MVSRDSNQFRDEEHLLAEDGEDHSSSPPHEFRRTSWGWLFPYSAALNGISLFLLASTWIYLIKTSGKAYIPNEVYCRLLPKENASTTIAS